MSNPMEELPMDNKIIAEARAGQERIFAKHVSRDAGSPTPPTGQELEKMFGKEKATRMRSEAHKKALREGDLE